MGKKINLEELAKFLVNAKRNTYASTDRMKIKPERPKFDELEYEENGFYYRDSYCGFFQAPGMEIVRTGGRDGEPIWTMAYSGGMNLGFHDDADFAKEVFEFLKQALLEVPMSMPFRGPRNLRDGEWEYTNDINGDIKRFVGHERVLHKGEEVFNQDYIGGLVIDK